MDAHASPDPARPYREPAPRPEVDVVQGEFLPPVQLAQGSTLGVRLHAAPAPKEPRSVPVVMGAAFSVAGVLGLALGLGDRAVPMLCIGAIGGVAGLARWWRGPRMRRSPPIVELSHEPARRGDSVSLYVESRHLGEAGVAITVVAEEWCTGPLGDHVSRARVVSLLLLEDIAAMGSGAAPWRTQTHFFVETDAPPSFRGARYGVDWRVEVLFAHGDAPFKFPLRVLPRAGDAAPPPPTEAPAPGSSQRGAVVFGRATFEAGTGFEALVRGPGGTTVEVEVLWRAKRSRLTRTEGPPNAVPEEHVIHASVIELDPRGEASLACDLPIAPATYVGRMLDVEWLVRIHGDDGAPVEVPFVVR